MVFGREPLDLLMQRLNLVISLPRTDELPRPLCWVGVGACIAMAKGVGGEKLLSNLTASEPNRGNRAPPPHPPGSARSEDATPNYVPTDLGPSF